MSSANTSLNNAQKVKSMLEILLSSDEFCRLSDDCHRLSKDYIEPSTSSENIKTNESTSATSQLNMCCDFTSCKSIHPAGISNSAILETLEKGNESLESIDKNVKIVDGQSVIENEKAVKDGQISGFQPYEEKLIKLFDVIRLAADLGVNLHNSFDKLSENTRILDPVKPEVIRAQVIIGENVNATGNIVDKIKNDRTVEYTGYTGSTGCTGDYGQNVAVGYSVKPEEHTSTHKNCIKIPKGLSKVLGSWRGIIGQNLVKVRFECTSEKFALLAYISICTPPTPPFGNYSTVQEGKEVLSPKVTFCKSFGENVLSIEDVMGQPLTAWVTNTDFIGKLADGSIVNLKRK